MQLPDVYIPSFYNAMQQGKADKRNKMINGLQDRFMISQKTQAEEQRKNQLAYNIADIIEQAPETDKQALYEQAFPRLSQLFPDKPLPNAYSKQVVSSIKQMASAYIPTEYKGAGDTLYKIQGSSVTQVGGGGQKGKIVTRQDVQDGVPVERSLYQFTNDRGDLQEGANLIHNTH